MTTGWSIFVIALILINVVGALWMLQAFSTRKATDSEETTHVWDGDLTEYNNPLPLWWLGLYWITAAFSAVYFVLYPGFGNFAGISGWTQEGQYEAEIAAAEQRFGDIFTAYADASLEDMASNEDVVRIGGNVFANFCAGCHGSDARGGSGFPNLSDNDWLHGGGADQVYMSIANGRTGVMPAVAAGLDDNRLDQLVSYVLSLSGDMSASASDIEAGGQTFAQLCVACHGAEAKGQLLLGAPNLTDDIWLYGGDRDTLRDVIKNGRINEMPAQLEQLGENRTRAVAAYVLSLSAEN